VADLVGARPAQNALPAPNWTAPCFAQNRMRLLDPANHFPMAGLSPRMAARITVGAQWIPPGPALRRGR
jgi:hypothetical protein